MQLIQVFKKKLAIFERSHKCKISNFCKKEKYYPQKLLYLILIEGNQMLSLLKTYKHHLNIILSGQSWVRFYTPSKKINAEREMR